MTSSERCHEIGQNQYGRVHRKAEWDHICVMDPVGLKNSPKIGRQAVLPVDSKNQTKSYSKTASITMILLEVFGVDESP